MRLFLSRIQQLSLPSDLGSMRLHLSLPLLCHPCVTLVTLRNRVHGQCLSALCHRDTLKQEKLQCARARVHLPIDGLGSLAAVQDLIQIFVGIKEMRYLCTEEKN